VWKIVEETEEQIERGKVALTASNKLRATSMSLFSLLSLDTIAWVWKRIFGKAEKAEESL